MTRRFCLILLIAALFVSPALVVAAGDGATEPVQPAETRQVEAIESVVSEDVLARGRVPFQQNCAACHAADGSGAAGPSFHANSDMGDTEYVIEMILFGGSFMTPFRNELNDEQIALIATFIRNSWGNNFGGVTPDEVAALR